MKKLLLALVLFSSFNLYAQTKNYDQDGTYKGSEVKSINIDFTTSTLGALPDPVVSENIQEYQNLGLVRFTIKKRPPIGGKAVNTLFNQNPDIDGNRNSKNPATIFFPKLENGAGSIRVDGWIGSEVSDVSRSFILQRFDESANVWKLVKYFKVSRDGTNTVETDINIQGPVRLKLEYKSGEYLSIKGIEISEFGQPLSKK